MDAYAIEAKEKMEKSIAAFKVGLSKLRSGRANPAMLNGIMCGELRQQIAKEAKALAEEAKVSIRNVRRDALDLLKIDDTMSDDYKKRVEDEIQKVVTESNKSVEDILAEKTKEILSI